MKVRIPRWIGMIGGSLFDLMSGITRKNYPISRIRIKKFCLDTMFGSSIFDTTQFVPTVELEDALERTIKYEFLETHDEPLFYSE